MPDLCKAPFLLFAGERFYPNAGWQDFRGIYPDLASARLAGEAWGADDGRWWHVVDLVLGVIVDANGEDSF